MIRSYCEFVDDGARCGKLTRARRIHQYCREHHKLVHGASRAIPHQIKKEKVVKPKKETTPVSQPRKRK